MQVRRVQLLVALAVVLAASGCQVIGGFDGLIIDESQGGAGATGGDGGAGAMGGSGGMACDDLDGDGICDDVDGDIDGDGCDNADDANPMTASDDTDGDDVADDCDVCDGDDDAGDTDEDGDCDDVDSDDDDDGCLDDDDDNPLVASTPETGDTLASDCDLCAGLDSSGDPDGDDICQDDDNCDEIYNPGQEDVSPADGVGDACIVIFVDSSAGGAGDGSSWDDAFTTVQAAVDVATAANEIWVAAGTYKGASANAVVVTLADNLALYGGFAGTEAHRDDRTALFHSTVLSGDFNGDDARDGSNRGDNSTRVVEGAAGAVLDGFRVEGGLNPAAGHPDHYGGGVLVPVAAHMTLRNLIVTRNQANAGGGLGVLGSADVEDCVFSHNHTTTNGGGVQLNTPDTVTFRRSGFYHNTADDDGGAIAVYSSGDATIRDSVFSRNVADRGVITHYSAGEVTITNSLVRDNTGGDAAIFHNVNGTLSLSYLTIAENTTSTTVWIGTNAQTNVSNSVFWGNGGADFGGLASPVSVTYTCAAEDLTSIDASNVHLDSSTAALGKPFAFSARLNPTSACVDAADAANVNTVFPAYTTMTARADLALDDAGNPDMGFHTLPPGMVPTDGLVAHYRGDGMDLGGSGNNATTNGDPTTAEDRFGAAGLAGSYDGDDYYEVQNHPDLPVGASARTLSIWHRSSTSGGSYLNWGRSVSGQRFGLYLPGDGAPYFVGQNLDINGKPAGLLDDVWRHVGVTYDGTTVRVYVDGIFNSEAEYVLNTTGTHLQIGRTAFDHGAEPYVGELDDLRIYDRVLSADEIQALFFEGGHQ